MIVQSGPSLLPPTYFKSISSQAKHGHTAHGHHTQVQGGIEAAYAKKAETEAVYAICEGVDVG